MRVSARCWRALLCEVCVVDNILNDSMLCVFFFQAEDGIRDLVRSRGLRDVYKRQLFALGQLDRASHVRRTEIELRAVVVEERRMTATPVSYTHLTLPTSDLV